MKKYLTQSRWSPYVVGALIGILSWMIFYFMSEKIGTTMTIQKIMGMIIGSFSKTHILNSKYYMQYFEEGIVKWQMAFVISIFLGSYVASKLSKERRVEHVPEIWKKNFGPQRWKRYLGAFIGGNLLIFGARFADGCTSGHAITGGLQLAVSGWLFIMFLFIFGIATSLLIYKKS
ncbi:MAG: hypothetical protein K940chlam1_00613 [Candidatus Anoxychlamydiales bacterium]|nr:hypothetical protein [Candidatus Anoxychlamydiales bacterium]NGX35718.1 hypothetical protein [Candidatus Anoxychlamydiales bacterium]